MSGSDMNPFNVDAWVHGDYVRDYDARVLDAAEAILLARYAEPLHGAVLEVGSGAGRITRVLAGLASDLHAVDVSSKMAAATAAAVPAAHVETGDLRDLSQFSDAALDVVVAFGNVIDVLDDDARRLALLEFHRVLRPGGVLLINTHNRAYLPHSHDPRFARAALRTPVGLARAALALPALPARRRNRRRARPYLRDEPGYAIANDHAHDYRLVHYYVSRDAMVAQLTAAGFEPRECRDVMGVAVGPGEVAERSSTLHYAAART